MPNPQVTFPAYFAPANAVAFANPDSTAQVVSAVTPLPVVMAAQGGTQPISAVALPLPAGAASAANQITTNTALSGIAGQLPTTLGQKTMALSLPVALASDSAGLGVTVGNFPATQAISAAALPLPAGAASAANQITTNTALSGIAGQLPATLGQKTMAQSLPVALASDSAGLGVTVGNFPATQAISAAALPLPSGAASAANQISTNTSLSAISGQFPVSLGPKTSAASFSLTLASDQSNIEPAGAAITGITMPAGGTGLTGWLSAIFRSCSDGTGLAGSVTSAAIVVSAGNNAYMGGSFQVTNAGTGCTVSYEQSNDGTTWIVLPVVSAASSASGNITSSTVAGLYAFNSAAAFVRARVSTYGSGTVSIALNQKQHTAPHVGISLANSTAAIGNVNAGLGFTDSVAVLAAAATFTGTGRANNAAQYAFFNATVFSDQAGTVLIDQSLDTGATYQPVASQAVVANGSTILSLRLCGAVGAATLYRVRYVNGATLQTVFRLSSSFSAS